MGKLFLARQCCGNEQQLLGAKALSTLRQENLKRQLYFYGYGYRPKVSVTKMVLFENALQSEET